MVTGGDILVGDLTEFDLQNGPEVWDMLGIDSSRNAMCARQAKSPALLCQWSRNEFLCVCAEHNLLNISSRENT